jgi:acetyltransferase
MTAPTLVAEELIRAAENSKKPILTSWMGGTQVEEARQLLKDAYIPDFNMLEDAVDAFSFIGTYNRNQRLLLQTPARLTGSQETADRQGARMIIEGVLNERRKVLTEPESMAILKAFKIPAAQNAVAHTPNGALVNAESIGYPVAMKVLSTNISHKSDAGGVRLNIGSAQEVRSAYREMLEEVEKNAPEAKIIGVTIAKMYRSPNGRELMIGMVRDPVFGPVISFGSGGTMVEVMGDSAISLPPLNRRLAQDLIGRTKAAKFLGNFRNMPAVDMEKLIDILVCVSNMACELPWIQEMDINPLLIDEKGAVAVDARFRVDYPKPSTDPYNHLAIHPYPIHLITEEQLNDGTNITIRPIRPEDAEIEQAFIRGLSAESKYFRFMNSIHELSLEMLVRFTQIDYHNEMALVAIHEGAEGEEEIGVARYMTNPDKKTCEFAIVVSDKWQGKGIARLLMQKLIDIARNRSLEIMEGQVLANNYRMLELMKSLNFQISNDPTDPGIKLAVQRLNY